MKAAARRSHGGFKHKVEIRGVHFATGGGGDGIDTAPTPQELLAASLAASSTVAMETYAQRKGWDIGEVVVEVDYEVAQRGSPARCHVVVRLPAQLSEEQRRRLLSVVAKSPVRRTLEGETMFDEHLEVCVPGSVAGNGQTASPPASNGLLRRFLPSSRQAA